MSTAQTGRARERQVAEHLRSTGHVVLKGTSFGICDLAAFRAGEDGAAVLRQFLTMRAA